jgi:hypothetical protein
MSAPLPDGVFHLLTADDTVHQTHGTAGDGHTGLI